MVRNVFGFGAIDLRARTATGLKTVAAGNKVAAAGKCVRVVQSPNDRHVIRDRLKEGRVVQKERNPVKMNDVLVCPIADLRHRRRVRKSRHRVGFETLRAIGQVPMKQIVNSFLFEPSHSKGHEVQRFAVVVSEVSFFVKSQLLKVILSGRCVGSIVKMIPKLAVQTVTF